MRLIFVLKQHRTASVSRVLRFVFAFIVWNSLLPPSAHAFTEPANKPTEIKLFTHGDTPLILSNSEGVLVGPALDLFQCSMNKLNRPFKVLKAPLSRARRIVANVDHALWFPSAFRGNPERMAHLVGPAGILYVYWYTSNKIGLDPNSDDFKRVATVTTYKGSAMAQQLEDEGYQLVEGSADRSRLVSMLLSGEVHAFAAVDFRNRLTKDMNEKLMQNAVITIKNEIPAAYHVSNVFSKTEPTFIPKFRNALKACLTKVSNSQQLQ